MSDATKVAPEPGIYRGVAPEVYHQWDAASNSRLSLLVPPSTPAHLRAALDEPARDKKVFKEGRILHAAVLEPERYKDEYRVPGQCAGITAKRLRCSVAGAHPVTDGHDQFEACHRHVDQFQPDPDALLVSAADDAMARACRAAIAAHPTARGFLSVDDAERELSIVWDQDVGGGQPVRCKARLDWYSPTFMGGLPMDLKGAREAHPREFRKQAFYNGYLRQAVLYRMGLQAVGLPAPSFAALAIEKVPPYALKVYRLGDAATGRLPEPGVEPANVARAVLSTLRLWAWCHETGEWPGYDEGVEELTTDEWAWSALDHQADQINDFLARRAA